MSGKSVFSLILFLAPFIAKGQQLEPTMTHALLRVKVMDLQDRPSEGEIITFISKKTDSTYEGITDASGGFDLLIPKGQTYIVNYRNFGYDHQYAEHEIPEYEGKLVSKINIKYRLPSKSVLENVHFEADQVSLDPTSFDSLDKLVELLKVKSSTRIRIAAHCDDQLVGETAVAVTTQQAEAIRNYLTSQGIEAGRLEIAGHGSALPMASNATPEGRQKNNRIEIEIAR